MSDRRLMCVRTAAAGIIGAGTNNARLAGLLRSLSAYYAKEPQLLFLVRVAQGLVHMGKGLLTLSPHHAHGQLLSGEPASSVQGNATSVAVSYIATQMHTPATCTSYIATTYITIEMHMPAFQTLLQIAGMSGILKQHRRHQHTDIPHMLQGRRWAASWRC